MPQCVLCIPDITHLPFATEFLKGNNYVELWVPGTLTPQICITSTKV